MNLCFQFVSMDVLDNQQSHTLPSCPLQLNEKASSRLRACQRAFDTIIQHDEVRIRSRTTCFRQIAMLLTNLDVRSNLAESCPKFVMSLIPTLTRSAKATGSAKVNQTPAHADTSREATRPVEVVTSISVRSPCSITSLRHLRRFANGSGSVENALFRQENLVLKKNCAAMQREIEVLQKALMFATSQKSGRSAPSPEQDEANLSDGISIQSIPIGYLILFSY